MLALVVMLCCPVVSGKKATELQRLNYGVVFKQKDHLQLATESWIHTFEISLPEGINLVNIFGCSQNKKTCDLVYELLGEINQIRQDTEIRINNTLSTIIRLIPEKQLIVKSRRKRALLSFIGDLSKSIFGTATTKDVEMLARHINSLNKISRNVIKSVEQHENDLSSFMKATDERITNIVKGLEENHLAIEHIQTQLYESFHSLETSFSIMSVFIAKQIEKSRQLESIFNELLEGIYDLVEGKMSPHLVSTETMLSTLKGIQEILHEKFPGFHLVYKDPALIYQYVSTIFARKGSKLYVSVKFPISPFSRPLLLFEILSFPVPVNETSDHATQLMQLPKYFAISQDSKHYTSLKSHELNSCTFNKMIECRFNKILTPVSQKSCVFSLFSDEKSLIKQNCNFRFLLNHISTDVVLLTKSSILVYNLDVLEFDCKNEKKKVAGCNFCVIHVPCECSVTTTHTFLPARLTDCHEETSEKLHPVNLALLQQFFNDSTLNDIGSNTLFQNPLATDVPNFKIYNHSMNQILADDNQAHLNLEKMANSAKNNSLIFQSLTESLLYGDISLNNGISAKDVILYTTASTAGISVMAIILMACKLRRVIIMMSVLQAQKVQASTVPPLIYKTLQPTPEPLVYILDQIQLEHILIVLCTVVIILLLLVVANTCNYKRNKTQLVVEITNGNLTVQVPLKHLSLCPTYWKVRVPHSIDLITVQGMMNPIIRFDWDSFDVTNKLTNQKIQIECLYRVTPWVGRKLRKIMKNTYCTYFLIQHNNMIMPLQNT